MPVVDNASRYSRRVSFAPDLVDSRNEVPLQQEQEQIEGVQDVVSDDGTGKKFIIPFQEHRLRFDQKFPEGLDLRIPESEYEIVLEQIHRELIKPAEKSQKSVRKWSVLVAGTAPVGVGFILSAFLARRVNRHQKALKSFWLSLRSHLKALNRDIYYARGIEWRIEKDIDKIAEREAYNKLLSFRIEIIFRKPISLQSGREVALHSVIETNRVSSNLRSSINSRFSEDHLSDPALFALLATAPGGGEYSYSPLLGDEATGVGVGEFSNEELQEEEKEEENRQIYSSPFLIPDHVVVADTSDNEENEEELLVSVEEPADVSLARATSVFEAPSPTPETSSVFTTEDFDMPVAENIQMSNSVAPLVVPETKKMTFADLLRSNIEEKEVESKRLNETEAAVALAGTFINNDTISPSKSPPELISDSARESRAEVFAQRQRKKFSRDPTTGTQLYDIPESPKLADDEDPTGDAITYINAAEDEDLINDIILGTGGVSIIPENFKPEPVVNAHFEDVGEVPVAAYSMADPFSPLYETDKVTPVDPPLETDEELEYTDVDGEVEYVRRKKWRVDPENAEKLSRVKTMSGESIHPSSRRSTYLPVTRTTRTPSTINFTQNK